MSVMNVFGELYSDEYDTLYSEKDYRAECDLLDQAITRYASGAGGNLLDVGCGTGGHAIEMARRGYRVTGVDFSKHMLDRAKQKAMLLPKEQRPIWLCEDARQFNVDERFDVAIMMFAVIGYLTDNSDVLEALRNIRRHLRTGAKFICDFWYGPSVLSVRPTDRIRVLATPDGKIIRAARTALDLETQTALVHFDLWSLRGDKLAGEISEVHRMRYFFPQEFALFLSQAAFELESLSAFPSLDKPLDDTSWNALAVAKAV